MIWNENLFFTENNKKGNENQRKSESFCSFVHNLILKNSFFSGECSQVEKNEKNFSSFFFIPIRDSY